jgi:hypothetical protein
MPAPAQIFKFIKTLPYLPVLWIRISFNPDRDPAFLLMRIRIRIRIQKKFTAENFNFFDKNCNLLIPRPPYRTSKLQEKSSSLKREHLALQSFLNFVGHFGPPGSGSGFPMRIRIQPTKINADPCGSGSRSTTLVHTYRQLPPGVKKRL